jgi:hypothetical protein
MKSGLYLSILLLVLGMISTVGLYLAEDYSSRQWFFGLSLTGLIPGILLVYLEFKYAKMWKQAWEEES